MKNIAIITISVAVVSFFIGRSSIPKQDLGAICPPAQKVQSDVSTESPLPTPDGVPAISSDNSAPALVPELQKPVKVDPKTKKEQ